METWHLRTSSSLAPASSVFRLHSNSKPAGRRSRSSTPASRCNRPALPRPGCSPSTIPQNPSALRPLAELSAALYPSFLDRIAALSGSLVPFQTFNTLEAVSQVDPPRRTEALVPQLDPGENHFHRLEENSIDPRQLATALLAAVRKTRVVLLERTALTRVTATPTLVRIETNTGALGAPYLIDCMGSWSPAPVRPRKGQMLAVRMPSSLDLATVIRTPEVYIVPRTSGPNAGLAIIGATIEDAGFDLTVHALDILTLNARATKLLPLLAEAKFVESWSGLRPATADELPILGPAPLQLRYLLATGHYRNGILLAPATARVDGAVAYRRNALGRSFPVLGLPLFGHACSITAQRSVES